jgi:hypothetical protein
MHLFCSKTHSSGSGREFAKKEDLSASAKVLFFILTLQAKSHITENDLEVMGKIPIVEFKVLILALLDGLPAAEALTSAAFSSISERVEIMNELKIKA